MIPKWVESEPILRKIQSLDFSVLSPEDILQLSKAQVSNPNLYEQSREPVSNGPLDRRMGIGNKLMICETCGMNLEHCLGHFGHMHLPLPIYHLGYFKHLILVLKMVCKYCYRVLLPEADIENYKLSMLKLQKNYITRLSLFRKIFKEASKNRLCPHCNKLNPTVQKLAKIAGKIQVKHPLLKHEIVENKIRRGAIESHDRVAGDFIYELSPWEAKKILLNLRKDEQILLNIGGSTELANLIIDHIVVPPVCIRPSVMLTNSLSNEDDLTIKLKEMAFLSQKISSTMIEKGEDFNKINKQWYLLQSHWGQYINADAPGLPLLDLKNKYIRSFCTRLKGKQGRFRQNLSGKRSNYTARTVISPDPNLHPQQVIVPEFMARILTIQEEVTPNSLESLQECVERGTHKRGGANFIIRKNQDKIIVSSQRGKIQLSLGDKVERHIRDGDVVIFNRQPSLHRISMMGFKVKVSEGKTLRFNECNCAPFNADFDGDEMNIHVPQTYEARSETLHLMGVQENILTPKSGDPIIALIQDFITTAYLLTHKQVFYSRAQLSEILSWFGDADEPICLPPPSILKPACLWTGKQVISSLLRPNKHARVLVNFETREKNSTKEGKYTCLKDGYVLFRNSELLLGRIGKNTLGGNKTGLIYHLLRDNTNYVATEVMHRFAKLSSRWLSNQGMTIGISDVTPSDYLHSINKAEIQSSYRTYEQYLDEYQKGKLEAKPGMSPEQTLESLLNSTLSKVRETVGDNCIALLGRHNKPLAMALCGSKGNAVNLSQMIGCVGQQTVGGKRIKNGFTERSLPHFPRLLETPESRGFVKNSFYTGLTATQFFFHTMGGREGIIDTAVKTADTGYMQRRLIKLIEDIAVMYDYTVRTCDRREIIQFRYGDDGLDPMKTQENKNPINFSHLQIYVKSLLGPKRKDEANLTPQQILQKCQIYIQAIGKQKLVVGLEETFQQSLMQKLRVYFQQKAQQLQKDLARVKIDSKQDSIYLQNCFCGLTERQLALFFKLYVKKLNKCIMEPGEAIGALTAQSIGQPATQMTLKTFHFAGISSMNITQGVPRVNEIINNTKNIATPIITIKLVEGSKFNAIQVKNEVEKLPLGKILHSIQEIYNVTHCSLNVILNQQTISNLGLKINIHRLRHVIDHSLKSKIKKSEVLNSMTINIIPTCKTNLMFELKALRRKLVTLPVGGIASIDRALISKDSQGKHLVFAQGLGLAHILSLEGVDQSQSFSNHITEIEECLGIEAARQSIINQITETMREHGVNVNPRHISLLSEMMTCKGKIIGFTRNGVDKMKDSTLMLASFEKTTDFLFDAATQGKNDRMRGISEKIIMGQPITIGTGIFDIKQDITRKVIYGK